MKGEGVTGCLGGLGYLVFWIVAVAAWLTAVIHDAQQNKIAWLLVDILVSPIGAIRGLMYWVT